MIKRSQFMKTSIISIQSQVVHGHVGNSAAVLTMQLHGLNVAAVPTTLLSNTPHFETMRGRVLEPELVGDLLRGVEERGLIETSRYIVSGYLGSRSNGELVAAFVRRARQLNPAIKYICDPVMGDANLGVFVPDQVIECLIDELVPMADVITPNFFEIGLITNHSPSSMAQLQTAVEKVTVVRQAKVVVTSCILPDTPENMLENIVFHGSQISRLPSPLLPIVPVGTGDLFTGLLTAFLARGDDLLQSAQRAARVVEAILRRTIAAGEHEIQLASVIDELLPSVDGGLK